MAALTTIEGIGPKIAEKMKSAGVGSVEKLLDHGASKQGRAGLAASADLSEALVARFVKHADLMRVKGIGGEYAELLEAAGVDSVPELAQRNPDNLHKKISEINEEKSLVRLVASAKQVAGWVDQANDLPKVITH